MPIRGASAGDSRIAAGRLFQKVQYPDSLSAAVAVTFAYNSQGEMMWTNDQKGRVIAYDRNSNLLTADDSVQTGQWMHFAYDERWRIVAMYEDDADASEPTEQFWYHNAGASGLGGSTPALGSAGEGRGGGSYIDDVMLRDLDTDGNGTLNERRYYLQNQHHDVVALINTSGSISERVNYDPYGSPIGTFTSIANRKGYAGYEYDAELGDTYHVRHRVFRSDLGVWTRRDPLAHVDGMGLYEYVMSRAVSLVDSSGTASGRMDCGQNCYERYQRLLKEIFKAIPGCWGPGVASFGKCELACVLACGAALVFGIIGYKVCLAVCTAACIGRTLGDFSTCWKRSTHARDNAKHSYCLCLGWKVRHCGGYDEPDLFGCDPNDPLYHRGRCP